MMKRVLAGALVATVVVGGAGSHAASDRHVLPDGFVHLDEAVPDLVIDLRYATENNFVGQRIDGYPHGHAILAATVAVALKEVQGTLRPFGLALKVFDAYRPQRAVDHFVRWGEDLGGSAGQAGLLPQCREGGSVQGGLHRQPVEPLAGEHGRRHHRVPRR